MRKMMGLMLELQMKKIAMKIEFLSSIDQAIELEREEVNEMKT